MLRSDQGRTRNGYLRHFLTARLLISRSSSFMARLLGLRDSMMAANLLAIAERGPALVHAHNGHLQRDKRNPSGRRRAGMCR